MKEVANLVSNLLGELSVRAKVGVNLLDLEEYAEQWLRKHKAESYNKGYKPVWAGGKKAYPNVLCLSLNDAISHGLPRDYRLQYRDLLTIDVGIKYKGYAGDAATTVLIGKSTKRDRKLVRFAKRAVYIGIDQIKAGVEVTEIGKAIEWYSRKMGYVVNKVFTGHSIGREMHEEPQIPMFNAEPLVVEGKKIPKLKAGQVICIEPHLSYKDDRGFLDKDGWTARTRDRKKCAMFEHMVEVLPNGYNILTNHFDLKG